MDQRQRSRGRPKGSAVRPYAKRVPKVVGLVEETDDDLTPTDRRIVREFSAAFNEERQKLYTLSRQGDPSAAEKLWTRFHCIVPALHNACSYVQSYMPRMTLMTATG